MSVGGGSTISAQVQLDLSQLKAQVDQATALTTKLGTSLTTIPAPKLDAQPVTHSAAEIQGVVDSLQSALGGLGAPHSVSLDTDSLKTAASAIDPVLKSLTGGMVSLGAAAAVTTTSIAALAVGATAAVLQLGEAYDHSFRLLQARTGETGAALEATRTALANLSATSPRSIEQLTATFIPLKQILGQTADQTATTTAQIIKFARATGTDAAQSAGDLARLFNAFGVTVAEQPKFLDGLTVAIQKTGISEQALVDGLRAAGPILRDFGLNASESTAFVAQLSTAGVEVQGVLRGLRTALGNVSGDQAKQQLTDLFNLLGDTGVTQATRLRTAIDFFGKQTGPQLLDLAEHGKLDLGVLTAAIDDSAGASDRAAGATKTNFDRIGVEIDKGKKAWAPYGLAAVEGMNTAAGAVLDGLGRIGQGIDNFLASDRVRQFAALFVQLANPPAIPATAVAAVLPGRDTLQAGLATGLPQLGNAASAVAGFIGTGVAQDAAALGVTGGQPHTVDQTHEVNAADRALTEVVNALTEATKHLAGAEAEATVVRQPSIQGAQSLQAQAQALNAELDKLSVTFGKNADGLLDYSKGLAVVLNENTALVPELLRRQKVQEDLAKGITQLSDLEVKAAALTLQHAAASQTGAERETLLAQASELVKSHLAAQADTQEQATEAQRKATEAQRTAEAQAKAVNDAYAKAANEGASVYQKRLVELADAALPGLTAAETAQLKAMEDLNDQAGILALVMTKLGLSEADAQALLAGTNAEFAAYKTQVADASKTTVEHGAAVKTLGDLYEEEVKGRIGSALGSLSSGVDAATAAQAKELEQQDKGSEALTLLASKYGVSTGQAQQWAAALTQGGSAAELAKVQMQTLTAATGAAGVALFEAREKLQAFTTYARDAHGTVRLKVEIDVEQVTHQIDDLQKSYQENSRKLVQEEFKATAEHLTQIQSINDTFQAASDKYSTELNTIETGRTKAAQDLTDQIGKASSAATDALTKLHRGFDDALQKYDTGVLNANNTLFDSVSSATKTFIDAAQSQAKAAEQSLRQVTDAQINAFRQVANAMSSFNQGQVLRDFNASVAQQNSQNQQNGFADSQSLQSAQRTAQVQAAGQAGLAQTTAEQQLNQAKNAAANTAADAEKNYQRTLADQEVQAEKTRQTYRDALDKARNANDKSLDKLDDDLTRQMRDFQLQEIAINKNLDKALNQAQTQHKETMKKLDDQVEAAQKAFTQAAQHHVEQLTKEEQHFKEQESARAHEQAQADKNFLVQLLVLERQREALVNLLAATHALPQQTATAIAKVLQLGPQQITQNIQNVNETGVDYADYLGISLLRRVRSGV